MNFFIATTFFATILFNYNCNSMDQEIQLKNINKLREFSLTEEENIQNNSQNSQTLKEIEESSEVEEIEKDSRNQNFNKIEKKLLKFIRKKLKKNFSKLKNRKPSSPFVRCRKEKFKLQPFIQKKIKVSNKEFIKELTKIVGSTYKNSKKEYKKEILYFVKLIERLLEKLKLKLDEFEIQNGWELRQLVSKETKEFAKKQVLLTMLLYFAGYKKEANKLRKETLFSLLCH